jgi:hypothetical protein
MPFWTAFANDDDTKAEERERHEAGLARQTTEAAYAEELRGVMARLAVNERDISRVDAELELAAPHWRALHEAERDRLLRIHDQLEGRAELIRTASKRYTK